MPRKLPANLQRDAGWRGAWHIITSRTFSETDARLWGYVDLKFHNIDWEAILGGATWSGTEDVMLRAACSLYNGDEKGEPLRDHVEAWRRPGPDVPRSAGHLL